MYYDEQMTVGGGEGGGGVGGGEGKPNATSTPVILDDGSLTLKNRAKLTMIGWRKTGYYDNYCDSIGAR